MIGLFKPKTLKTELTAWLGMFLLMSGIGLWGSIILEWAEIELTTGWMLFLLIMLPIPAAIISDAIVVYYSYDESENSTQKS